MSPLRFVATGRVPVRCAARRLPPASKQRSLGGGRARQSTVAAAALQSPGMLRRSPRRPARTPCMLPAKPHAAVVCGLLCCSKSGRRARCRSIPLSGRAAHRRALAARSASLRQALRSVPARAASRDARSDLWCVIGVIRMDESGDRDAVGAAVSRQTIEVLPRCFARVAALLNRNALMSSRCCFDANRCVRASLFVGLFGVLSRGEWRESSQSAGRPSRVRADDCVTHAGDEARCLFPARALTCSRTAAQVARVSVHRPQSLCPCGFSESAMTCAAGRAQSCDARCAGCNRVPCGCVKAARARVGMEGRDACVNERSACSHQRARDALRCHRQRLRDDAREN